MLSLVPCLVILTHWLVNNRLSAQGPMCYPVSPRHSEIPFPKPPQVACLHRRSRTPSLSDSRDLTLNMVSLLEVVTCLTQMRIGVLHRFMRTGGFRSIRVIIKTVKDPFRQIH